MIFLTIEGPVSPPNVKTECIGAHTGRGKLVLPVDVSSLHFSARQSS